MRNKLLIKIVAIILLLVFSIQEIGFAEVLDLREIADTSDYIGAVLLGGISGIGLSAIGATNAMQLFVATYAIPEAAKGVVEMAGIKDKSLKAVLTAFIAVFMQSYASGVGALGKGASEAAEVGKNAIQNITKGISGFFKKIFSFAEKAVKNAFANATVAAVMTAVKEYVGKALRKAAKTKAGKALYGFLLEAATLFGAQKLRQTLQKWLGVVEVIEDGQIVITEKSASNFAEILKSQDTAFKEEFKKYLLIRGAEALLEAAGFDEIVVSSAASALSGAVNAADKKSDAMWKGLFYGLISGIFKKLSRLQRNPMNGALFNFTGCALLRAALAPKEKPGQTFLDIFRDSVLVATTDFLSFGRATYSGVNIQGHVGFVWVRGNDVFFLNRYTDYIRMLVYKGMATAMAAQLMSSLHYAAVKNTYDIIGGYIKTPEFKQDVSRYAVQLKAAWDEWDKQIQQAYAERDKLQQKVKLQYELAKEQINVKNIDSEIEHTQAEEYSGGKLYPLSQEREAAEERIKNLREQIQKLEAGEVTITQVSPDLSQIRNFTQQQATPIRKQMQQLQEELERVNQNIGVYQAENDRWELATAEQEKRDLEAKIAELKVQLEPLEAGIQSLQKLETLNSAIQRLESLPRRMQTNITDILIAITAPFFPAAAVFAKMYADSRNPLYEERNIQAIIQDTLKPPKNLLPHLSLKSDSSLGLVTTTPNPSQQVSERVAQEALNQATYSIEPKSPDSPETLPVAKQPAQIPTLAPIGSVAPPGGGVTTKPDTIVVDGGDKVLKPIDGWIEMPKTDKNVIIFVNSSDYEVYFPRDATKMYVRPLPKTSSGRKTFDQEMDEYFDRPKPRPTQPSATSVHNVNK